VNKEALFLAVVEDASTRAVQPTAEAIGASTDPGTALRMGCLAWIRLADDPVVRQIVLIDAPAVLGWQRWRELDEQGALGVIRGLLSGAAEAGRIEARHVDVFAHIVVASINEVALMLARTDDRTEALATAESAVNEFLDRLLGEQG
jgi:AcrR family transcriptional regulator